MINHLFRQWVALLATAALAFAGLVAVLPTASADAAAHLPDITAAHHDGNRYVFDAGAAKLRVTVEDADLLRVEITDRRRKGSDRTGFGQRLPDSCDGQQRRPAEVGADPACRRRFL